MTCSYRPWVVITLLATTLAMALATTWATALPTAAGGQDTPRLVANIGVTDTENSFPSALTTLQPDLAIFVSRSPTGTGHELWRTDGTAEGTQQVATLPASNQPYLIFASGQRAVLYAHDRSGLWSTDGTVSGTVELISADIEFVHHDTYRDRFYAVTEAISGQLQLLYSTDGTPAGTQVVEGPFTEVGHFYGIHSTQTGTWIAVRFAESRLWRTDGTTEGTSLVLSGVHPRPLFGAGEHLIFTRQSDQNILQFWRTNGTLGGTELIPRPDTERAFDFYGINFIGPETIFFVVGDLTFFESDDAVLYHLDPRTGPITEIASFDAPITQEDDAYLNDAFFSWTQATVIDDVLYFTPRTKALGFELWRSDGTVAGTRPVADLCPGPCSSRADLRDATQLGNEIFLPLDDGSAAGNQIWRTAGTAATTRVDPAFDAPTCPRDNADLTRLDDRLLVARPNGLWITDGTPEGTGQLATSNPSLFQPARLAAGLIFPADDGIHGFEPWITDGTPSGTGMIKDLAFIEGGSKPRSFTPAPAGNRVFFVAEADRIVGEEIWTALPTGEAMRVASVPACNRFARVSWLHVTDTHVFFAQSYDTDDPDHEVLLWVAETDGTNARSIATFSRNSLNGLPQSWRDGIVFRASDRLWVSDGTESGTRPITPEGVALEAGWIIQEDHLFARQRSDDRLWVSDGTISGSRPLVNTEGEPVLARSALVPFNGRVYFDRSRTDGTPAGTTEISGFADLTNDPAPEVATGDHLYYTTLDAAPLYSLAHDETVVAIESIGQAIDLIATDHTLYLRYGDTVWITRGTEGTTRPLLPAPFLFFDDQTIRIGDQLYFTDGNTSSLWTSDGTPEGTRRLATDFNSSFLHSAQTDTGVLYLEASDPESGSELWRSDGSIAGTLRVADIEPGPMGSEPGDLAIAQDHLYFAATTTTDGREPWTLQLSEPGLPPLRLGDDDRFELTVHWTKPNGENGAGQPVRLTNDTGTFWFFRETNVELVVKVLDGRPSNGHFWVFYGSLSNVEYSLEVRDTVTGAVRTYDNPQGNFGSTGDTQAFPAAPDPATESVNSTTVSARTFSSHVQQTITKGIGTCANTTDALCLQQQRFRVEVTWTDGAGNPRTGTALPLSPDTGYFWFGNSSNVELIVKVLDGRNNNGSFWVFYGALSNLAYTLTVTDTETGAVQVYDNPRGTFASRGDTGAFPE